MIEEHTHDDCVQCLQKEVRRLKEELHDAEVQIETRDDAYKTLYEEKKLFGTALAKLGVFKVGDNGYPLNEAPCVHCGFPKYKHSSDDDCPCYTTPLTKKYTP